MYNNLLLCVYLQGYDREKKRFEKHITKKGLNIRSTHRQTYGSDGKIHVAAITLKLLSAHECVQSGESFAVWSVDNVSVYGARDCSDFSSTQKFSSTPTIAGHAR